MTRALVVHCHPDPGSFTAAVRDAVVARLRARGAEVRVIDLYAEGFDPALSLGEWRGYAEAAGRAALETHAEAILWCDALLFTYPTWWYGPPAALKGWLDRALLPGVAFHLEGPDSRSFRPGLRHVRRLGAFTTCGASRWVTWMVGSPGRRTLLRGVGLLCHPRARRAFVAHYLMDASTPESRARHLARVERAVDRLLRQGTGSRPR